MSDAFGHWGPPAAPTPIDWYSLCDMGESNTANNDNALCVCGHSRNDHVTQPMSVEMPANPNPIYPDGRGVMRWNGGDSYDHDLCPCGCTIFDPDA